MIRSLWHFWQRTDSAGMSKTQSADPIVIHDEGNELHCSVQHIQHRLDHHAAANTANGTDDAGKKTDQEEQNYHHNHLHYLFLILYRKRICAINCNLRIS